MNLVEQINRLLADSIVPLNGLLAIVLVLLGLMSGVSASGAGGIFTGLLTGVAMAIAVCGALALLIQIRNLLAKSLSRQQDNSGNPPSQP